MHYYAVIDTNVVVSAVIKWDSIPGSIINLVFNGIITPLVNEKIMQEYRAVLLRPKFHLTEDIVDDILGDIGVRSVYVQEKPLDIILPD